MRKTAYTLEELASPLSPITSTAKVSILLPGKRPNSISMPPFLFYALKAKRLAAAGIADESKLSEQAYDAFRLTFFNFIRQMARHVNQDIIDGKLPDKTRMSATIQQRIASIIFSDSEDDYSEWANCPVRSINATSSKKNVTIPEYLFQRLSDDLGLEKTAMLHIQQAVSHIKRVGLDAGVIQNGDFTGEASHSSWSKKLYNHLMFDLIKLSDIPYVLDSSMLKVKQLRDMKAEVTTQKRLLSKPSL